MSNIRIETDLKEILDKIDGKLDNLQKGVTDINLRLTKVETKLQDAVEDIKEIESATKGLITEVSDLKGAKSLIIPIVVAVTVSILTLVIRSIPVA